MPAKPLTDDQQRDAARLRAAYDLWISARKEKGLPATQEGVSDLFGFGQSALSQYLTGRIPLNAEALLIFSKVFGIQPANISPSIVEAQQRLANELARPVEVALPATPSGKPPRKLAA